MRSPGIKVFIIYRGQIHRDQICRGEGAPRALQPSLFYPPRGAIESIYKALEDLIEKRDVFGDEIVTNLEGTLAVHFVGLSNK